MVELSEIDGENQHVGSPCAGSVPWAPDPVRETTSLVAFDKRSAAMQAQARNVDQTVIFSIGRDQDQFGLAARGNFAGSEFGAAGNDTCYRATVVAGSPPVLRLQKVTAGSESTLAETTEIGAITAGTEYRLRFLVADGAGGSVDLKAKVWLHDGVTGEPEAWSLTHNDAASPLGAGRHGLYFRGEAGGEGAPATRQFHVDNHAVAVRDLPAAPAAVRAYAISTNRIDVAWLADTLDATSLKLEVSEDAGSNWTALSSSLDPGITNWSHLPGANSGSKTFQYRLCTVNPAGQSAWTQSNSIQLLAPPPALPAGRDPQDALVMVAAVVERPGQGQAGAGRLRADFPAAGDRTVPVALATPAPTKAVIPGTFSAAEFDTLGNRTSVSAGLSGKRQTFDYNKRNQLTRRTTPGVLTLRSVGVPSPWNSLFRDDVSIECRPSPGTGPATRPAATLDGHRWAAEVEVDNSQGPVARWITVRFDAGFGLERQSSFWRLLPASVEYWDGKWPITGNLGYDRRGNLVCDSICEYVWDARDLLVEVKTRVVAGIPAAARVRIVNEYDAFGRRVVKKVYRWNSVTNNWNTTPQSVRRFVYDGWKVIAELKVDPGSGDPKTLRSFVWGLDLSGTWGGAAGVGGLLAVNVHNPDTQAIAATYLVVSDANGNVTALIDAATRKPLAQYEYDAFGYVAVIDLAWKTLESGALSHWRLAAGLEVDADPALLNPCPFLFSTKWLDAELPVAGLGCSAGGAGGLYYFGYRWYDPSTGRWLSRDPIAEEGGLNLYAFCGGDPINCVDVLGLEGDAAEPTNEQVRQLALRLCQEATGLTPDQADEAYEAAVAADTVLAEARIRHEALRTDIGRLRRMIRDAHRHLAAKPVAGLLPAGEVAGNGVINPARIRRTHPRGAPEMRMEMALEHFNRWSVTRKAITPNPLATVNLCGRIFYDPPVELRLDVEKVPGLGIHQELAQYGAAIYIVHYGELAVSRVQEQANELQVAIDAHASFHHPYKAAATVMMMGGAVSGISSAACMAGMSAPRMAAQGGLRARMGDPPSGMIKPQAHHDLPQAQRFQKHWDRTGLDIDDPAFGRWVEGGLVGDHQKWSDAFNREWDAFFNRVPAATREQILEQMNRLRKDPRFR